ncbi:MAG: S1 RNA-binding domain-containing protein [Gammaproteobacteria bacterium]|nr:S1 RNA-binding domain-containing protein [Gammaproteobacteria bacterium]
MTALTGEAEIGQVYTGKVVKIVNFGAFVNLKPGKDGLVHISQIAEYRIESVEAELSEGQTVNVKVLDVDKLGRVKLTMKEVQQPQAGE